MALYVKRENVPAKWLLAVLFLIAGCGGGGTEPPPSAGKPGQTTPLEAPPPSQGPDTPGATGEPTVAPAAPTTRGVVMANRELRLSASGPGVGHIDRSLDVLERQIIALLPGLRDAYDTERTHEPALMGSLDVSLTIEPNGAVSDVRFPVKRVSDERLTAAAFKQMRMWTFLAADLPVFLHFTVLFVPPGVDEASILLWEKRLGSRPVVERDPEAPASMVTVPAREPERRLPEEALKEQVQEAVTPPSRATAQGDQVARWYRVTRETVLRTEPRESADVVRQLRKGIRVRVVGMVKGRWLEVHSVAKRPPGFLWWRDAEPEPENTAPKESR
ncbi:MAG: hypothetical protein HYZ50_10270 [Deltaproteobacteria bacterium]|nr:hypothetical protein [Deltaproteobacteria bacterium]